MVDDAGKKFSTGTLEIEDGGTWIFGCSVDLDWLGDFVLSLAMVDWDLAFDFDFDFI